MQSRNEGGSRVVRNFWGGSFAQSVGRERKLQAEAERCLEEVKQFAPVSAAFANGEYSSVVTACTELLGAANSGLHKARLRLLQINAYIQLGQFDEAKAAVADLPATEFAVAYLNLQILVARPGSLPEEIKKAAEVVATAYPGKGKQAESVLSAEQMLLHFVEAQAYIDIKSAWNLIPRDLLKKLGSSVEGKLFQAKLYFIDKDYNQLGGCIDALFDQQKMISPHQLLQANLFKSRACKELSSIDDAKIFALDAHQAAPESYFASACCRELGATLSSKPKDKKQANGDNWLAVIEELNARLCILLNSRSLLEALQYARWKQKESLFKSQPRRVRFNLVAAAELEQTVLAREKKIAAERAENEKDLGYLLKSAQDFYKQQKYAHSKRMCQKAIAIGEASWLYDNRYALGELLFQLGLYSELIKFAEILTPESHSEEISDLPMLNLKINAFFMLGDFKAVNNYVVMMSVCRDIPIEVSRLIGLIDIQNGGALTEQTHSHWQNVIDQSGQVAGTYARLTTNALRSNGALVEMQAYLDQPSDSLNCMHMLLSIEEPKRLEATFIHTVRMYFALEDYNGVIVSFCKIDVSKLPPHERAEAYVLKSRAYIALDQREPAAACIRYAQQIVPQSFFVQHYFRLLDVPLSHRYLLGRVHRQLFSEPVLPRNALAELDIDDGRPPIFPDQLL